MPDLLFWINIATADEEASSSAEYRMRSADYGGALVQGDTLFQPLPVPGLSPLVP
jgi:hypothetical protein